MARSLLQCVGMQRSPGHPVTERQPQGVTAASAPTVAARGWLTGGKTTGYSGIHRAARVVTTTSQLGAIRRAVIVVNELAPHARAARWREVFADSFGAGVEIIEVRVRHFEGATAAARGAAAWGAELVIAVGGDGTVNACVNGIGAADTRIAVVPAGTANDLAHLIGNAGGLGSFGTDWERRDIDAITVNGTRYYSAGGAGFAADVAHAANRWRASSTVARLILARMGSVLYTLVCVLTILFGRRLGARLQIRYTDARTGRDTRIDANAYGILVANCARVGKSFQLAPVSDMSDGAFELIIFPRTSRLRLLRTVLLAQRGRMFEVPEMCWIQVTRAEIVADSPLRFFGDGEILDHGQRFDLALASTPVRLLAPATCELEPADERPDSEPIPQLA